MNRSNHSLRGASERVWLPRSPWRIVAALLLLAVVVVALALAAGFWWARRARQTVIVRQPAALPARPVATVILPASSPSVVEVYPATVVRTREPRVTVRSPGGTVAEVAVRVGEWVRAGQPLVRLEEPVPGPVAAGVATPTIGTDHLDRAREREDAARLRRRLEQLRYAFEQVRRAAAATEGPSGDVRRAGTAVAEAEAAIERARQTLAAAAERRRRTDDRYRSHLASRFQLHLARSGALLAQVKLRDAEERESGAREALRAAMTAVDPAAAARAERLEVEAGGIEARLARVNERVAGAREQLPPAAARRLVRTTQSRAVAARAPRAGIVSMVSARAGETLPPGAPLLALTRPGRPFLRARVGRSVLPTLSPGAWVAIRPRSGHTFTARVTRVRREPDGGGLVELAPPPDARPDEGAVLVPPNARLPAPTLPAAALQREQNETRVWIAASQPGRSGGWIARRQTVRAAGAGQNRVAIVAGLRPGDRVIVAGAEGLRDGQPVALVERGTVRPGE